MLFLLASTLFNETQHTPNPMFSYYIDNKGYMRFTDSKKLVHRWAAEKKLGRKLNRKEVVHHINRNKLDNHPDNLYICKNQWQHYAIHRIDAKKFGWQVSLTGFQYQSTNTSDIFYKKPHPSSTAHIVRLHTNWIARLFESVV
jgi:hypothetical protein